MVLVRLLLFLALAAVAVAAALYLVKRDRRYLRFIGLVVRYTPPGGAPVTGVNQ